MKLKYSAALYIFFVDVNAIEKQKNNFENFVPVADEMRRLTVWVKWDRFTLINLARYVFFQMLLTYKKIPV